MYIYIYIYIYIYVYKLFKRWLLKARTVHKEKLLIVFRMNCKTSSDFG